MRHKSQTGKRKIAAVKAENALDLHEEKDTSRQRGVTVRRPQQREMLIRELHAPIGASSISGALVSCDQRTIDCWPLEGACSATCSAGIDSETKDTFPIGRTINGQTDRFAALKVVLAVGNSA